jgi:hypothetical protein
MHHYVIGDVHGYYQTLMKLPENTTLVFVGDLIDMGMVS